MKRQYATNGDGMALLEGGRVAIVDNYGNLVAITKVLVVDNYGVLVLVTYAVTPIF